MADLQRIIEIVFQATDKTGNTISSVGSGLDAFANKAQSVTGPLADATDFILKIDTALIALGVTMAGFAINSAGRFQDSTSEINTLLDISGTEFNALEDDIKDYARTSTQSLDDVTQAIYSAISNGVDYRESIEFVTAAEKLAVAGRADLNSTTLLLAGSLNAYGKSSEEAEKFSDILFATVQKGNVRLPELASSLAKVTGIADAAGVPFADLTAAVATLTASGIPASEAITGVKAALTNIIKPSKEAKDAAKELNVEFGVNAVQSKGLDGVLNELATSTGRNVTELGRFFGSSEALNSVLQLTKGNGDKWAETLLFIEQQTGGTQTAYEKMVQSFTNVNQNLKNNLEITLVDIGERLLKQYGDTAKALGSVFDSIGAEVDKGSFDPVLDLINQFGIAAQLALENIAKNLGGALDPDAGLIDWTGFTDAVEAVGEALGELFDGVDISSPEGLSKAIQSVIDVGALLGNATAGIVRGLDFWVEKLVAVLKYLSQLSPETQTAAGEIAGFGKGLDAVLGFLGPVGEGIEAIGFGLQAIAGASIVKTFTAAATAAGGLSSAVAGAVNPVNALGIGTAFLVSNPLGAAGLINTFRAGIPITADFAKNIAKSGDSIKSQNEALQSANPLLDRASTYMEEFGSATEDVLVARRGLLLTEQEINNVFAPAQALIKSSAEATQKLGDSTKYADKWTVSIVDGIKTYTQRTVDKTAATRSDTKALEDQISETEKYRLELEKIASNERIKNIEARVNLDTAELEAQTATVLAAFQSIDNTVTSTGELLGDLFGTYAGADAWEQLAIGRQIDLENKRREEALKLQEALVNSQVRYLDEKTAALARGDAIIKITGDGLEPELEAFMWRIIEKVQIRASDEGAEFLLGI